MFFEFCGQGARVFSTQILLFSIEICLKLEPLEFLLLFSFIRYIYNIIVSDVKVIWPRRGLSDCH